MSLSLYFKTILKKKKLSKESRVALQIMLVNQLFESAAGSTSASISCLRGYYSKMAPGTVKRAIAQQN